MEGSYVALSFDSLSPGCVDKGGVANRRLGHLEGEPLSQKPLDNVLHLLGLAFVASDHVVVEGFCFQVGLSQVDDGLSIFQVD